MNILVITSSYPASSEDPTGTAGFFIRDFSLELSRSGHTVIVAPVRRKERYEPEAGLKVEPIPWRGGDRELASMNIWNPAHWWIFFRFFVEGAASLEGVVRKNNIKLVLCCWVIPSGIFGYWLRRKFNIAYDTWALGSDIWKIRRIPVLGPRLIRKIVRGARRSFADGPGLAKEVEQISGIKCHFLPSSRKLPFSQNNRGVLGPLGRVHLLYVGRYHHNKGPDLLLVAMDLLPDSVKARIFLRMFGFGPLEQRLRQMVNSLNLNDIVSVGGAINAQEFSDCLEGSSFVVIPSRIESIPVVFSDAMQRQVPVIVTPAGDLPDFIDEFKCGIAAEAITPQALCAAVIKAVQTGSENFKEGTRKACERFQISQCARAWSEGL